MKKNLLIFSVSVLLLMLGFSAANAQCTPNAGYTAKLYHDNADGDSILVDGSVGVPYSAVILLNVPVSVTNSLGTFNIDSIQYLGTGSQPTGLGFTGSADKTSWAAGTQGCVAISGTPTTAGQYSVSIQYNAYVTQFPGTGYPFEDFPITMTVTNPSSINDLNPTRFDVTQNQPNPFSKITTIYFNSLNAEKVDFKVFNMLGKEVYVKNINALTGRNLIEFSAKNFAPGIYMYTISNKNVNITKRMIITKN